MELRNFAIGFSIGAVLAGAAAFYVGKWVGDRPVDLPIAEYFDGGDELGYLVASGLLTGEDMKGNTWVKVACVRDEMICRTLELQISDVFGRHINEYQDEWPITEWKADRIVAQTKASPGQCNTVRFDVYRSSHEAVYTRIPTGENSERCKSMKAKTFSWKLSPPL